MSRTYCIESSDRRKSVKVERTPDDEFVCITSRLGHTENYIFLSPSEARRLSRYLMKLTRNKGKQPHTPDIRTMKLEDFFCNFAEAWK